MKISFDTNNDSYDDALSALNAAYGVESQSEETLAHGAGRGTEIKTVPMTRDEFEELLTSVPQEYRVDSDFYGEEIARIQRIYKTEEVLRNRLDKALNYHWCPELLKNTIEYLLSLDEITAEDFLVYNKIQDWLIMTEVD